MTTLAELIAQRDALEQQIKAQQNAARTDAIKQIQSLMADFGLTADDLGKTKGSKASKLEGAKVAAKYSHPTTGETWTGRGLKPRWLTAEIAAGKSLESFKV